MNIIFCGNYEKKKKRLHMRPLIYTWVHYYSIYEPPKRNFEKLTILTMPIIALFSIYAITPCALFLYIVQ